MLTNARIVSMEQGELGYQPSSPKTVVIKAGKIDASLDSHIPIAAAPEHKVIDCQGKLITPGLIDCHTHLIYAGNRANEFEMRLQGVPYPAIAKQGGGILSTVHATRTASIDQLVELALPRLEGLLRSGVTSVEIKSGYGLTLHDEIKMLKAA
ncbi:MAG: imidazolonepropionase, partial [Vibrio sp.]|nr:imidazolonepropionase [Vibrio sp.]